MVKSPLIVGNWKMHKTSREAQNFCETIAPQIAQSQATVYLAVPFTLLPTLETSIILGAQNMHDEPKGAFTGEISAHMLKDAGAQFVLLGHSERRHVFGETDRFINRKVKRALAEGIEPILCIGETLEQRESGHTHEVLKDQLLSSLEGIDDYSKILIAYEPVWAIGTGKVAHVDDAQSAHAFIRGLVGDRPILYGGSVKPDNAQNLLQQPDIDGLLVGGASLEVESFSQIINGKNP